MDSRTADDHVTDCGPVLSIFVRNPHRFECDVCIANPNAVPAVNNPHGTRPASNPAEASASAGEVVDELAELGEVAALDHRHDRRRTSPARESPVSHDRAALAG